MADAPRLNSATDSAAKYAPLSGWAVASAAVGGLFVVVMGFLVLQAWGTGQPLLNPLLFLLAVAGLVLAFLGWRHVRTSEGARTGAGYAAFGWWVCLVGGACYAAYCFATDLAVRAEAEKKAGEWGAQLLKGNPSDPADASVRGAFVDILDPGQGTLRADPKPLYSGPLGIMFCRFRNSPLVQLPARYRDAAKFTPHGLREWQIDPDGKLLCVVSATLTCPEGEFPVRVPLIAVQSKEKEQAGRRAWQVNDKTGGPDTKFLDDEQAKRTRYGWLVVKLQQAASVNAYQFCQAFTAPPPLAQVVAAGELRGGGTEGRAGLLGGAGILAGPTDPPAGFFARPDGTPMTDDPFPRPDGPGKRGGLTRLRGVWSPADQFVVPFLPPGSGRFVQFEQATTHPVLDLSDPARVRVRVPVEFRPPTLGDPREDEFKEPKSFAVGWLVLDLTDPAALQRLAETRAAGGPATREQPVDLDPPAFTFKVVRLETDLMPMTPPQAQQQGGPGGK